MGLLDGLSPPPHWAAWRALADRWQATYHPGDNFADPAVELEHGPWWLRLELLRQSSIPRPVVTRLRVPFVNREGFRFRVRRAGLLSGVAKRLGAQDVEIGDARFDAAYVVKATDAERVRALLTPELRLRLLAQERFELELRRCRGVDGPADELRCVVPDILSDADTLDQLVELLAATLDQLAALGIADPQARPLRLA